MGGELLRIICLYSLALCTSAINIDQDCVTRQKYESNLDGTHTHIRAWVNGTEQSSLVVRITLEFDPKGIPETFDIIKIWRNQIEIRRVRENTHINPQNITFDQPLAPGWMEMVIVSGDEFVFIFPNLQNTSYSSAGEKERLRKITIEGSCITVDCKNDIIYWKIENHPRIIPLELNIYNDFSMFSRKEYIPSIKVGEKYLQLGINDDTIDDISSYKESLQVPLSGHKEYFFSTGCINGNCKVLLGEKGEGQEINLPATTAMTVSSRSGDSFTLLLHLETASTQTTVAVKSLTPSETPNDPIITVVIISLAIALVVVVLVLGFLLWKSEKNKDGSRLSPDFTYEALQSSSEDMEPTLTFRSSMSSFSPMVIRLWDAVVHSNIELIRDLLKKGANPANKEDNTPTTPLQEAHLLGDKKITTLFKEHLQINTSTVSEELISTTMKILDKRISEVFAAAKYGQYDRNNGVSVLLKSHSLPGTIRNSNGWSLVHYIAAARFSDERPAWEPTDIRNFFNEQKYYINGIDHWGNTALHILATQKGNTKIIWDGKELPANEAWIQLAKLLIEYGCDPRIVNHQNMLPWKRATNCGNHEMSKYLKQISEQYGPIDHEASAEKYEELVEAVNQNDTSKITSLLKEHVPLLPMFAEKDLLAEALRSSHAETVFLLLCAGVPICNCSIDDLTPLEVAHNTIGLPALFPALMRKVYAQKLKEEISKITSNDEIHQKLKKAMENMHKDILVSGSDCKWKFEANDKNFQNTEAKQLLCVASSLGLSLAVQLLGMEDFELHPLQGEENPVYNALCGNHMDVLYALFRDLKMAPYTTDKQENIPERLQLDFWISEYTIFKRRINEVENQLLLELDEKEINMYLDGIKSLKLSGSKWKDFDSKCLYMFSRCGLVYLLHQLSQTNDVDFNKVIQQFSGSTMIHISSQYGHLHFTEYLLFRGADPSIKTKGNFTAAHIAAITAKKETMNYVLAYMKHLDMDVDEPCILKTTATKLLQESSKMNKGVTYQIMKTDDAFHVKNEVSIEDKAYQILKKKGKSLDFNFKDDLMKTVKILQEDYNSLIIKHQAEVVKEMNLFGNNLKETEFEGILKGYEEYHENIALSNDVVGFVLELDRFSALEQN